MTSIQATFAKAVMKIQKKYDLSAEQLPYSFHDTKSVSVDGELHAILNGMSEYLGSARTIIDDALSAKGYYIENVNGCDFNFYKS